jgi:hypothetical protein
MKIPEIIETITAILMGIVCIVIAIIGFVSPDSFPHFISSRVPEMTLGAIGIIALFLVVERYSRLRKISESIEELKQSSLDSIFWETERKPEDLLDFKANLFSADSLYLLGYSLPNILDSLRVDLPKAVNNGLNVRILMYLDNNTAFKLTRDAQEYPEPFTQGTQRGRKYVQEIQETIVKNYKNPKGSFEAKSLSWVPSCSMIMFIKRNKSGIAKIILNRPSIHVPKEKQEYRDRLNMLLQESKSKKMFDYFREHFELLWNPGFRRSSSNKEAKKPVR